MLKSLFYLALLPWQCLWFAFLRQFDSYKPNNPWTAGDYLIYVPAFVSGGIQLVLFIIFKLIF